MATDEFRLARPVSGTHAHLVERDQLEVDEDFDPSGHFLRPCGGYARALCGAKSKKHWIAADATDEPCGSCGRAFKRR